MSSCQFNCLGFEGKEEKRREGNTLELEMEIPNIGGRNSKPSTQLFGSCNLLEVTTYSIVFKSWPFCDR
jgi:hypothetical protein